MPNFINARNQMIGNSQQFYHADKTRGVDIANYFTAPIIYMMMIKDFLSKD